MAEEVNKTVEAYMKAAGLEQGAMSRSTLRLLIKADETMERRSRAIDDAREAIKANQITITAVAKDMGVARKTIHNNPAVHDYIALRANETKRTSEHLVRNLREKVSDLEAQMEGLLRRDAETEEVKLELARMQESLTERETLIRNLRSENASLRLRLAEAETQAPPKRAKIIKLKVETE